MDCGVYALWTATKLFPDHLQASVRRFDPTVKAFNTLKQYFLANPQPPTLMPEIVEMGVRKLAIHKMSFSGIGELGTVYGGQAQVRSVAERWNRKLICQRIDRIHPILRGVRITNGDFLNVVHDESRGALLYCDPPYSFRSRRLYRHDFEVADHVRLRDALQITRHEWVLSYDDVPEIRALYASWAHIERIPVLYSIRGQNRTHELLLCKRDYRAGWRRHQSEPAYVPLMQQMPG